MSSLLGTTLGGRYRLESRIGAGGMSTVYRAHDETLERWVAIKVMKREIAEDSGQLERFRREAKAVAKLSHPNIVHVIDAGEDEGHPYIVFEYVAGETLKERIRRVGRLEIAEAATYGVEIARALGAAHANGVVHRDVKPQNVLIDQEGTAKVTDFGIARTLEEQGLTDDGRVLGTTDYVSPEQALGQEANGQADLYSLGVVLYEMLTGELPFQAETQVAVAMKHVREPMPDIRRLRPEVSASLATVVDRATAKELDKRYASERELIRALENVLVLEAARTAGRVDATDTEPTAEFPAVAVAEAPARGRLGVNQRGRLGVNQRRTLLTAVAVGTALAVAAVILLTIASKPDHASRAKRAPARLQAVSLCSSCAYAYNPYGTDGPQQNNALAYLAVDGRASTSWSTELYYTGQLDKPGVGIYVVTPRELAARKLVVLTPTPGFSATVYGARTVPSATNFTGSAWVKLASQADTRSPQSFTLGAGTHQYRYYLVWITKLPPNSEFAKVAEIELYR